MVHESTIISNCVWCLAFWKWDFWSYLPNLWYFVTVYFSLIDILLPFTEKMTGARKEGEEVRSANYFIKLLPCGPLLRTWESTFRKLTSISNNCFFIFCCFRPHKKILVTGSRSMARRRLMIPFRVARSIDGWFCQSWGNSLHQVQWGKNWFCFSWKASF